MFKLNRANILISAVFSLLGLLSPQSARAQTIYTMPQTVQVTIATGTACTGGLQTFTTGTINGFDNLGQTIHTAIATPAAGITSLSVQVFGVDTAGNQMAISDQAFAPTGVAAIATGSGYFSNIRIIVQCATGTFNLTYSGSSSSPFINAGTALQNQLTKLVGQGLSSASAFVSNLFTPFANSSGLLWYSTVTAAGGAPTVVVSCSGGTPLQSFTVTFSPASASLTTQSFALPASPCWNLNISYTPNGASGANNLSIGVSFNAPGLALYSADPCQSPLATKSSVPINVTTATTTQLVALTVGQTIYVCGMTLTIAPSGTTADTATFEYGTGATCGTGTTALTGALGAGDLTTTTGLLPISFADPGATMTAPAGNALCIVSAGTTVNIQGIMQFVKQ